MVNWYHALYELVVFWTVYADTSFLNQKLIILDHRYNDLLNNQYT